MERLVVAAAERAAEVDPVDSLRQRLAEIAGQLAVAGRHSSGSELLRRAIFGAEVAPSQFAAILRSLVAEGESRLAQVVAE